MTPVGQSGFPDDLAAGYAQYREGTFQNERDRLHDLAEHGQHPKTMVIGCCDSRVMPERIFNVGPGDIFDVRNIANLVPPFRADNPHCSVAAAVSYAVEVLAIGRILVLGHSNCGGVRAFAQAMTRPPQESSDNPLARWIETIAPAARDAAMPETGIDEAYLEKLALASIRQGVANLRGIPGIAEREASGTLSVHGAYFRIADGTLLVFDEVQNGFYPAV